MTALGAHSWYRNSYDEYYFPRNKRLINKPHSHSIINEQLKSFYRKNLTWHAHGNTMKNTLLSELHV